MRQRYVGIALPESLINKMDEYLKDNPWGYKSRAELTKEAIRKLLMELKK